MTLIVGIVEGGRVHMASDSLSADDRGTTKTSASPKVVRIPGPAGRGTCPSLLFGFTTSWRFGQAAEAALLEAGWKAARHEEIDVERPAAAEPAWPWPRDGRQIVEGQDAEYLRAWMIGWIVPTVRAGLKAAGFAEVKDNVEKGGESLVAIRGRLFRLQTDFAVVEPAEGYDAVGAGEQIALGALAATAGLPFSVGDRIAAVTRAVERHNVWVRGPWKTETA